MMKLFFLLVFVGCNEHDLQSWGQLHPKYNEEEANPKIPEVVVEALAAEILNHWVFPVKLQSKQEEKIDYQSNAVTSPIKMRYNVYNRTKNFTQRDRRRSELFTQTATPTTVSATQSYPQKSNTYDRALDILLVVDTSGSMKVERKTLGDNLSALLTHVEDTDWQIAVTTTDVGDCLDSEWIIQASKRSTFANIITKKITQKISGQADTERPILMAVNALGGNLEESERVSHLCRGRKSTVANNDWVRSASHIVVIIITDEPSPYIPNFGTTSAVTLQNQLEEIGRTAKEDYQIHGIVSPQSRPFYEEIITYSGGVVGIGNGVSADKKGYDIVLNEISTSTLILLTQTLDIKDIAAKANPNFTLNSVRVSGSKQNNGAQISGTHYTYADNIITFLDGYIPGKNSTITVDYSYITTATRPDFDLDYTPLSGSITVNPTSGCSGWTSGGFTVHNKKVTFANEPPDGCKFALEYKRADISLTSTVSLSIPSDEEIVNNSIKIGNKNVSSNFNAATKKLRINPASNDDGKNFTIKYQTRKRKLQYDLKLENKLTDTADITCDPPPCQYEKGKLIFEKTDFTNGKTIQVKQPLTTAKYSFSLVEGYKTDTLSLIITDRSNKQSTCNDLDIQNNEVILDSQAAKNKCAKLNDIYLNTVTLNPYKYLDERKFTISDTNFFTYHQHRSENWTVYIDNQKQSAPDYDVDTEKRAVSFKAQPPAGSEVKIEVSLTL